MIMDFVFDINSVFCDLTKTALEEMCREGKVASSLAIKYSGLKLSIIGNAGTVIKLKIAWDSGDSNEVGKAVFAAVGGYIGAYFGVSVGILLEFSHKKGFILFKAPGEKFIAPVALGYLGDQVGNQAGEQLWEYMSDHDKGVVINLLGWGQISVHVTIGDSSTWQLNGGEWEAQLAARTAPSAYSSENISRGIFITMQTDCGWNTLLNRYGDAVRKATDVYGNLVYNTIVEPGTSIFIPTDDEICFDMEMLYIYPKK